MIKDYDDVVRKCPTNVCECGIGRDEQLGKVDTHFRKAENIEDALRDLGIAVTRLSFFLDQVVSGCNLLEDDPTLTPTRLRSIGDIVNRLPEELNDRSNRIHEIIKSLEDILL
jgi:hypothetical protein